MSHYVVVGGGQAGSSLVCKLRALGFEGKISLVSDENVVPYQRPPLSKKYLLGQMDVERLFLRPADFYKDQNIDVMLDTHVSAIDPERRVITIDGNDTSYDELALATGSAPRLLPAAIGGQLNNVFAVRTLADVDTMQSAFDAGGHVLIIGGGYIGLEAAAVAADRGLKVTLVEMADRILQRVACQETSDFFRDLHQSHGVKILEGVGLDHLSGDGAVAQAKLTDGSTLDIDFAIVGVGITPNIGLAEAAGLEIENGIKTNEYGRTSDAHIWAAGDCASFPHDGGRIRLESVPNAIDQAEIVAQNMMGGEKEYQATPWFWSDQFDQKLQIAGLNTGFNSVVVRSDGKTRSHWYYLDDTLLAVDAMNDPRAYMVAKRLIEGGKSVPKEIAADPESDLKALLRG